MDIKMLNQICRYKIFVGGRFYYLNELENCGTGSIEYTLYDEKLSVLSISDDPDDIMYPTIYNYDNWLYEKEFQSMKISTQFNSKSVVTQFNSKSIEIQQESNSKVEEVKEYVYSKQDLLLSKHYESQDAQEELNKAMESLDEAKNYLGQAEWTQNEGASFLSTSDYEEAYYKYLHSVGMAKKVWDPIIEINKAIKSADELETEYQEIIQSEKTSESNQIEKKNEKTCFLFWCW